jgi:hypothetical protein
MIRHREWLTLVVFLIVPGLGFSQSGQQTGTLVVTGHPGQAPVTHLDGRSWVAVDALAHLMNGSLGYRGNQITLTLPGSAGGAVSQPTNQGFSRDFLNATIETISDIREWRSALLVAVENASPAIDRLMEPFRAQVTKNLRLASVAATTEADREALQLLTNSLGHMHQLDNKVVAAQKSLSYITADSLRKDPLDQKILMCARALGEMAANDQFQANGACR